MAKTEEQLRSMGFKQLRELCKTLGVTSSFGGTKGGLIKSILAADPPLTDNNNANDAKTAEVLIFKEYVNEEDYKSNKIGLKQAIKIVKKNAPVPKVLGASIYTAFSQFFGYENFANLSMNEFANAVASGNTEVLGNIRMTELYRFMNYWTNPNGVNGWLAMLRDLKGFVPPPDTDHKYKLMFSVMKIDNITRRIALALDIDSNAAQVQTAINSMNTFSDSMEVIMGNEIYQKILLSSIVIAKFRNEDIDIGRKWYSCMKNTKLIQKDASDQKHHSGKFLDCVDFLNRTCAVLTPMELFEAKKWDKLKEQGVLHKNVMISVDHDECMDDIRKKAIEMGTAVDPPINSKLKNKKSREQKQKEIESEIAQNRNPGTKMEIQNKLNMALSGQTNEGENGCDADLSEYHKMISLGVAIGAVQQKMTMFGISNEVIAQFVDQYSTQKKHTKTMDPTKNDANDNDAHPSLSSKLMNDLNNQFRVPAVAALPSSAHTNNYKNGQTSKRNNVNAPPVMHGNQGLVWGHDTGFVERTRSKVQTAWYNLAAFDQELYQQLDSNDDDSDDYKDNDANGLHDETLSIMVRKIDDMNDSFRDFYEKGKVNEERLKRLDVIYHSKFRPVILKEVTESRYVALIQAVEVYNINVTSAVIGVIWMFVKPFDALVELKFAVDCVEEFFEKEKMKINMKKLPLQSHRGYEPNY